jgi:uncharacterized membrane protein YuzA (DUF378 family)
MADELIRCPSCNHELRLPRELFGQPVECPQCGNRFSAPAAAGAPAVVQPAQPSYAGFDGSGPQIRSGGPSVRAPAIALIIVAGIAAVLQIVAIVKADEQVAELKQLAQDPQVPVQFREFIQKVADSADAPTVRRNGGILLGLNVLTILGAAVMLQRRIYALAIIGAIVALNPLNCPCCVMQAPFGVWALIVLLNADVRRSFQ